MRAYGDDRICRDGQVIQNPQQDRCFALKGGARPTCRKGDYLLRPENRNHPLNRVAACGAAGAAFAVGVDPVVWNRHHLGGKRKCAAWHGQAYEHQLEPPFAEEMPWVAELLQATREIRAAWK